MANYQLLKADIDKKVYQNGAQEITGANLNSVLNEMVTTLGAEYQFAGVATIATNPGTPDAKVFYIANGKGTYTNFGGINVTEDEVVVLYWDTAWHKEATGIASRAKLTELESNLGGVCSYTSNKVVLPNGSIAESSNGAVTAPIPVSGSRARWEFVEKATATDGTNGVLVELNSSFQVVDYWLAGEAGVTNFNIGANTKYLCATMSLAHIKECNILVDGVSVWSAITPNELVSDVHSINKTYGLSALDGYGTLRNISIDNVGKKIVISSDGIKVKYNGGTFTVKGDEYQMSYSATSAPNGGWVLSRSAVESVVNGGNIEPSSSTIFYASANSDNFNNNILLFASYYGYLIPCGLFGNIILQRQIDTIEGLSNKVTSLIKTTELSVLDGYEGGLGNLKIDDVSKKVIVDSLGLRIKYGGGTFTIKGDEYQMSYSATSAPNGGWVLSRSAVEKVANGGNITPSSTTIFYADVNSQDFKDNILLFASYYGYLIPCGLFSSLILKRQMDVISDLNTPMKQYAFNSVYNEVDITTKCKQFSALMNNSGDVESFIFMTDPHLMGTFNSFDANVFKDYISIMQKYYNMLPIDLMICGGDWLNSNDYQEGACWKLGYVDATMRKLFKHYYPILGNHDTNYHGVVSATDSSRGDLSHDTIRNLMFRENGNSYYTFKGNQTRFFVFDTGTDWEDAMTSYRYEQLQWFANSLLSNTDEHIVILQHIYYQGDTSELFPMSAIEQSIIGAFNNRSSIVVNGQTYNFANARGKIYCIIAGHSHMDSVNNTSSVPVILTTNMMSGNTPTFDMCLIDYTSKKLKMVRVGTGNDRTINL